MRLSHMIRAAAAAVLVLSAGSLFAQQRVVYVEGDPTLKRASRSLQMRPGQDLNSGDRISTGIGDMVELQQGEGNSITIHPNTTFSISELSVDGSTERQLTTSRGAASFRFTRPGGSRRIGTATTAAGVRGTEFTVFSGMDGAALYVVTHGLVAVESRGVTVEVAADQAVEVAPDQPPGEVVSRIGREQDFSDWNGQRLDAFLQDPQGTMHGLTEQLVRFARQMEQTHIEYLHSRAQLEAARERMKELQQEDQQEFEEYRSEVVFPLASNTANLFLNSRYYALSALSLRRHVAGTLYLQAKARALLEPDSQWSSYLAEDHAFFLQQFEIRIIPLLEDDDF
ncbi:MAG: FecR family protein [Spirochaeta sp.]